LTIRTFAAYAGDSPAVPRFSPGNTLSIGCMLASVFVPSITGIDITAA